jgi:hypothetical protein
MIWNKNWWEDAPFYTDSLNLRSAEVLDLNSYSDAFLFLNYDLAWKYAEFCIEAPDRNWLNLPGGARRRTDVLPFLSKREGDRSRPTYT